MGQQLNSYNIAISSAICLGGVTYGYGFAVFVTSIGQPGFYQYFDLDPSSHYTARILGAVNALFAAGAAFGALAQSWLADWVGRKRAMAIAASCAAVGGALTAGSVHIVMLIIVRILQGFGLGLIICLVSIYLTEVAPARQRGLLSSMTVCSLGAGYLINNLVAVGTYSSSNLTLQWRLPLALACLGAVCLLISLLFIPESPRYLAWVGKHDEAWEVVRRLHYDPDDPEELTSKAVLDQIARQVAHDKEQLTGYRHIVSTPSLRKRALLVVFLGFASQSTGVLGITNFIVPIFNSLNITGRWPLVFLVGYSICGNASAWINAFLVDRVGRRLMLLVGFPAIAAVLIAEAALQSRYLDSGERNGEIACLVFIFLFIMTYQIVEAPIFVFAAEIFPTTLRAMGIGLNFFSYSVGAIVWTAPADVAFKTIAWGMYCIWAGLCLVCAGMVYFLVPETARLPMEEIAELFGDTVVVHLQVDGSGAIEAPGTDAGGDNLQKLYVSEHVEEEKEEPQGKV